MSTLKPYPAYKDSGFEWLGEVPEHWNVDPLGRWFTERKTTVSDEDFQPLSVTKHGIVPQLSDVAKTENNTSRKLVLAGDFAINSRSDRKGSSGVSELDGSVSVITTVLRGRGLVPKYTHYLLRSQPFQEEFYRWGHGIVEDLWSTRWSEMKDIRLPIPPASAQRAIADFLDRETAEIDAFVAESEKLITLLNERRAAVITQAVTKGLDPTAPMKDTGIEWLGQIPAHWGFQGMSPFVNTWSGAGFPDSEQGLLEEALPFYKVNALGQADSDGVIRAKWDTISIETAVRLRARIVPSDAMILAKIGAALLLGRVRRVEHECCIDNNMMAVVPKSESIDSRFLQWALQTISMELHVNPGAVPSLNVYSFIHHELALPPLDEQEMIATHLEVATAKIDQAIETAKEAIALAKERRQALISAAVTGKIDVRSAA